MLKTLILINTLFYLNIFSNKFFNRILNIFLSTLIIFIFTFNRWSNDYQAYSGILFTNPEKDTEIGYTTLVNIFKYFQFNFNVVLFMISILVIFSIKKIKNHRKILTLYIIYPLILDLNQVRNTLMILFIIISLNYFLKKCRFKGILLYLLGISFQSLGWIYMPFFIIFKNIRTTYLFKCSGIIYIINLFFCLYLNKMLVAIQSKISYNRIILKLLYYIRPMSYSTLILWTGLFVIDIYLIEKLFKFQDKDENELTLYYKFILYCGSLIPIFTVVSELNRVYRNTFLVKYILVFYLFEKYNKNSTKYFIFYAIENLVLLTLLYIRGLEIDKTLFSFFYF